MGNSGPSGVDIGADFQAKAVVAGDFGFGFAFLFMAGIERGFLSG